MKDAHPLLKSIGTASAILSVLGLAAVLIFLGDRSQVVTAASSTPGFTTFDAPGAGTTANVMQGTAAFAIDTAGDIAGYYIDAMGGYHGFLRPAAMFSALVFLVILAGGVVACSGSSSGGGGSGVTANPGTTSGNYTATVVATSGTASSQGSIMVSVQ
jgi:hypothetical protein